MSGRDTPPVGQIRAFCLQCLTRREHSQHELLAKLELKGFSRRDSFAVMAELAQQGWQSDRRYAESYARSRIRKGFGPIAIGFALSRQGIADVDLDGLAEAEAGGWHSLLTGVYHKKYPEPPANANEWAKRCRFLQQRGFTAESIKALYLQEYGENQRLGR